MVFTGIKGEFPGVHLLVVNKVWRINRSFGKPQYPEFEVTEDVGSVG